MLGLTSTVIGGAVAGALHGGTGALIGGAGGALVYEVLANPEVQSHLAIALYHASKGAMTLGTATSRVEAYVASMQDINKSNKNSPADTTQGAQ